MKIALVGYGLMGHEIEALAATRDDVEVTAIACREDGDELTAGELAGADVAIDFSAGHLVASHIETYIEAGIDAVIGTTSWDSRDPALIERVETAGIGVMVGENFSPGAQVFARLVGEAARRLTQLGGYDIYGFEIHHAHKLRAPSGTAEAIARAVLANTNAKTSVEFDRPDGQADPSVLRISAVRGGTNPGRHEMIFDSEGDEIRLTHQAHSRRTFAAGALLAARDVHGKHGWFYFEDLFE